MNYLFISRSYATIVVVFFVLIYGGASVAQENYFGFSIGPTHMIGIDYEKRTDNSAIQMSAGLVELAFSGAITYKKFWPLKNKELFVGGGYWGIIGGSEEEAGLASLLKTTVGLEWKTKKKAKLGIELSLDLMLYIITFWGGEHRFPNTFYPLPLPGIYYRW